MQSRCSARSLSIFDPELVIEPAENRRQHLRQVLRDQAGTGLARGLAVHPGADLAASKAGTPCASIAAIIPASTSPAPAVASQGGALEAMVARPSGDATTVSGPLSSTTAPTRSAAAAHPLQFRAIGVLVADIAEQARKLAFMRRQHDLPVVRCLDGFEQAIGGFGKAGQRVGVQHQAASAPTAR